MASRNSVKGVVGAWRTKTGERRDSDKYPSVSRARRTLFRCVVSRNCWFGWSDVIRNFSQEALPFLQSSTERLDKSLKAFPAFDLSRRLGVLGEWRRDCQPKPDEKSQCLGTDADIPFQALNLSRQTVEPARERGFHPIGSVG